MTHPVSQLMQALENFCQSLNDKEATLTGEEYFKLLKILYIDPLKSGEKSNYFKRYLSNFFDLNVISAVTASAGKIEYLKDHFETMRRSPNDAVYIAFAVFNLINHIAGIKRWETSKSLFIEKLYLDLIQQPKLARSIVSAYNTLLDYQERDDLTSLLKKDKMIHLFLLGEDSIEKIKKLELKDLEEQIERLEEKGSLLYSL